MGLFVFKNSLSALQEKNSVSPLTCTKHSLIANESQFIHTKHFLNVLLADCQGGLEVFKENDPFYQMLQVLVKLWSQFVTKLVLQ